MSYLSKPLPLIPTTPWPTPELPMLTYGYPATPQARLLPESQGGATKALQRSDTLREAHTTLALAIWLYDFDSSQAIREFQRAIELNPNYAIARTSATTLSPHWAGSTTRSSRESEPSSWILSLSSSTRIWAAITFMRAVTMKLSLNCTVKTLEMDPGVYIAHLSSWSGPGHERRSRRSGCGVPKGASIERRCSRARLWVIRWRPKKCLDQLKKLSKERYVSAYSFFALVSLGLGDKEEALRWLEQSYQDRAGSDIGFIRVDPLLDQLCGDPRFEALAEKIVRRGIWEGHESKMNLIAFFAD